MPLDCLRANVFILSSRLDTVYLGGLEAFQADWPDRAEDGELVRLHPGRDIDSRGLQSRLHRKGMEPGRDYALTDLKGRPERLSNGIAFERTMDIAAQEVSWRARAGTQASNVVAFPRIDRGDTDLLRGREFAPMVIVRDECSEVGRLNVHICVNPEGRLVFQRTKDSKSDGEYGSARTAWSCRTVRPEHVPRVLVELIADRFECEEAFADWLKEKGIESELMRVSA